VSFSRILGGLPLCDALGPGPWPFAGVWLMAKEFEIINQSINQSNYIIVRPKVDQRASQLSLPHAGITKTEKIELKRT